MPPAAEEAARRRSPVSARRISPAEKIALVPEVLGTYRRVRRELRGSDLPTALRALRGTTAAGEYSGRDHMTCNQMAGAVRKTLALIPTDTRCLMQSLTLTAMLARRGIATSLVIGVNSGQADPEEEFGAHAWVEYHGTPVLPVFRGHFERLTAV